MAKLRDFCSLRGEKMLRKKATGIAASIAEDVISLYDVRTGWLADEDIQKKHSERGYYSLGWYWGSIGAQKTWPTVMARIVRLTPEILGEIVASGHGERKNILYDGYDPIPDPSYRFGAGPMARGHVYSHSGTGSGLPGEMSSISYCTMDGISILRYLAALTVVAAILDIYEI